MDLTDHRRIGGWVGKVLEDYRPMNSWAGRVLKGHKAMGWPLSLME